MKYTCQTKGRFGLACERLWDVTIGLNGKGGMDCWERRNMDPGLNPSGRLAGPVIRTCTRHFWRSPREP